MTPDTMKAVKPVSMDMVMQRDPERSTRLMNRLVLAGALCAGMMVVQAADAKDLLAPKEQETTEVGSTQSPSFDEQKKGVPQ